MTAEQMDARVQKERHKLTQVYLVRRALVYAANRSAIDACIVLPRDVVIDTLLLCDGNMEQLNLLWQAFKRERTPLSNALESPDEFEHYVWQHTNDSEVR